MAIEFWKSLARHFKCRVTTFLAHSNSKRKVHSDAVDRMRKLSMPLCTYIPGELVQGLGKISYQPGVCELIPEVNFIN